MILLRSPCPFCRGSFEVHVEDDSVPNATGKLVHMNPACHPAATLTPTEFVRQALDLVAKESGKVLVSEATARSVKA